MLERVRTSNGITELEEVLNLLGGKKLERFSLLDLMRRKLSVPITRSAIRMVQGTTSKTIVRKDTLEDRFLAGAVLGVSFLCFFGMTLTRCVLD
jgi:hypothetical protein